MATINLPADHLGDVFARAGVAMLQRMANAQATIGGQAVVGSFATEAALPQLGAMQVQASRLRFDCLATDLPPGIAEGASVTISAQPYLVALRTDHTDLGQVTLELERA